MNTNRTGRYYWLALLVTVTLVFVLHPPVALASTAAQLETQLNGFNGSAVGGSGTLSASVTGVNEVTVAGSVTGATSTLALDIDSGVTVKWQASYSGTSLFPGFGIGTPLIELTNAGTFEIVTGGSVSDNGNDDTIRGDANARIIVGGGSVTNTNAEGTAINGSNITVNGGTVTGSNHAIITYGSVTVNGGTVSAAGGFAIYMPGTNSNAVTINGGTVSTSGSGAQGRRI